MKHISDLINSPELAEKNGIVCSINEQDGFLAVEYTVFLNGCLGLTTTALHQKGETYKEKEEAIYQIVDTIHIKNRTNGSPFDAIIYESEIALFDSLKELTKFLRPQLIFLPKGDTNK